MDKMIFREGSLEIPYEIIINKRLKYMRIRMDLNGMKVCIPSRTSIKDVESMLESHRKWIVSHFLKLQSIKNEETRRKWQSGETILYRGKPIDIVFESCEAFKVSVSFDGNKFNVQVGQGLVGDRRVDAIQEAFKKWYIERAREVINEKLNFFSSIIGVSYNVVRIKEQKTRWGSCSSRNNLNFNWRLIMAPDKILDYVIIHELCHLKYLNHSREYWSLVENYYPGYKEARRWLKEKGQMLKL